MEALTGLPQDMRKVAYLSLKVAKIEGYAVFVREIKGPEIAGIRVDVFRQNAMNPFQHVNAYVAKGMEIRKYFPAYGEQVSRAGKF